MATALLTSCTVTVAKPAPELKVSRVADGDTLTVADASGHTTRVRLLGIDAPELAHDGRSAECGAEEAGSALTRLAAQRPAQLVTDPHADPTDRYGRTLAYLALGDDGTDPALQLLRDGLVSAWYPRGEPAPARYRIYRQAQEQAQEARTGSWATCPHLGR